MATDAVCDGNWSLFAIEPVIPASHLADALESPAAIRYAYDAGLLELLGLSLTVLGVAIAVFAVFGFFIYGHIVDRAARKETKEIAPEVISDMLRNDPALWVKVIRDNPATFKSALKEALDEVPNLDTDMPDSAADDVAVKSAGDGDDGQLG